MKVLSIVVLLLLGTLPQTALACSCMPIKASVEEAYKQAFAVFTGKVIAMKTNLENDDYFIARVDKVWKGDVKGTLKFGTRAQCALVPKAIGEEYLFYASTTREYLPLSKGGQDATVLSINHCGRTAKLEKVRDDIRELDRLVE